MGRLRHHRRTDGPTPVLWISNATAGTAHTTATSHDPMVLAGHRHTRPGSASPGPRANTPPAPNGAANGLTTDSGTAETAPWGWGVFVPFSNGELAKGSQRRAVRAARRSAGRITP
jgi:hypothetical protein